MGRISSAFQLLKQQNKKGLIPFIAAGDPSPRVTVAIMRALVEHGADLIELGIPFSDPVADGPIIQRASERAVAQGISLRKVLQMVERFRQSDTRTPVILMGYLNPIEVFGYEEFAGAAAAAGVDGVIIVDMPPEEAGLLNQRLRHKQIDQIFLIAPTTTGQRIEIIAEIASGFLYYVSVKGVTGGKGADIAEVNNKLALVRQKSDLPVAVGFGIKDAESAARIADCCDAVVIGSALVEKIHDAGAKKEDISADIGSFISLVRRALDKAAPRAMN